MYCVYCGEKINDNDQFCTSCGMKKSASVNKFNVVLDKPKIIYKKEEPIEPLINNNLIILLTVLVVVLSICSILYVSSVTSNYSKRLVENNNIFYKNIQ